MSNLFIWIYSGGGGREVHETLNADADQSFEKCAEDTCNVYNKAQ
jgi:hypothetical protein